MTREQRVYGGPGTGKTTYLARQLTRAVQVHGPNTVMVCSFSNAAASELVSRDLPIPSNRVGTLHSFCRRALEGTSRIAETVKELEEWNRSNRQHWHVPRTAYNGTAEPGKDVRIWTLYGISRNRLIPREDWRGDVQDFAKEWEAWKTEQDLIDFTDLIEIVYRDGLPPPYPLNVLFADEAQDYSALEMAVVRAWGETAEVFVLAGDDQQALYHFRGADPKTFLFPTLPPDQLTVLGQSYRLPSEILDYAAEYGRTMDVYHPKDIKPLAPGGQVCRTTRSLKEGAGLCRLAVGEVEYGHTVMILASCAYMLNPVLKELRRHGEVFHNPYRPTYNPWNPGKSMARMGDFLRPEMRWRHVWPWFEHLDTVACGMDKGAKSLVKGTCKMSPDVRVDADAFQMFTGFPFPEQDPEWLMAHTLRSKQSLHEFALTVVRRHGLEALQREPRIIVGTYHSVKGGEADVVLMSPDLSRKGAKEYRECPDPTRRMMYVGMTRGKAKVIILAGRENPVHLPAANYYQPPVEVPF